MTPNAAWSLRIWAVALSSNGLRDRAKENPVACERAKNEQENIGRDELTALRKLAAHLIAYDDTQIARMVASGTFMEVACNEQRIQ